MRCPDCRGEIEGRPPFCPHCGRTLSGGAARPPARAGGTPGATGPRRVGAPHRPWGTRPTGEAPSANRPFAFAETWRRLQERSGPLAPYLPLLAYALAGGVLGALIPGITGLGGAFVGLMIGLSHKNRKKKS